MEELIDTHVLARLITFDIAAHFTLDPSRIDLFI